LVGLNNINVLALAISGNNVIAGTDNGIYQSTNNGTNWIIKNQGITTVPHMEAILVANNYIFAVLMAPPFGDVYYRISSE